MSAQLFNNPNGRRGGQDLAGLTMAELYKIINKSLIGVEQHCDTDAVCQNIGVRIEKKLGIYPNLDGFTLGGDD